jgi:hypothetical protein
VSDEEPRVKQWAKWRIRIEVESDDGYKEIPPITIVEATGSWENSEGKRTFLECLCIDVGALVGAVVKIGNVPGAGDATDAFHDGFSS